MTAALPPAIALTYAYRKCEYRRWNNVFSHMDYQRREDEENREVEGRNEEYDAFGLCLGLRAHGEEVEIEVRLLRLRPLLGIVV